MTRPLAWVNRDSWFLLGARAIRTFAQRSVSVLIAVYFGLQGLSLVQVGAILTIGSIGSTTWAIIAGIFGDSFGRRKFLVSISILIAISSVIIFISDSFAVLAVVAFIGGFGAFMGMGAAGPLEQAMIATSTESVRRTELFAVFGIAGTAAASLGALGAGVPDLLQNSFGLSQILSFRAWFIIYPFFILISAFLLSRLSNRIEVADQDSKWSNPLKLPSRRRIFSISGLFTIDSFGTGMIAQSLASYFFFTRFGLQASELGLLFFASSILTAISLWVAPRLARRIGLVNTMVFTHIPASIFLIIVPFIPSVEIAISIWLVRAFFIQMDAPTSQSYTMAVVKSEERTAMASASTVSRSAGGSIGPSVGTALWSAFGPAVAFIVSGTVKIAYDLTLWFLFRRIKPPEELTNTGQE